MKQIKFSVVIPTYNTETYIEKCIQSVLLQNYKNIQIVVVDDGSTDSTKDILKRLRQIYPQILVISKPNGGLGSARNTGVRYVDSDYFMFLDSDDYILDGCFNELEQILKKKWYDIVSFNLYTSNDGTKINTVQEMNAGYRGEHNATKEKEILQIPTLSVCKMYKTSWYKENTFQFLEGILYEDVSLVPYMISKATSIYMIGTPYYVYYQRAQSIMHRQVDRKMLDIMETMNYCRKLFENSDTYNYYFNEIENIAVCTVLFQVTEMINAANYKNKLQNILIDFMKSEYKNGYHNKYLNKYQKKRAKFLYQKRFKEYFYRYTIKRILKTKLRDIMPASIYYLCSQIKKGL